MSTSLQGVDDTYTRIIIVNSLSAINDAKDSTDCRHCFIGGVHQLKRRIQRGVEYVDTPNVPWHVLTNQIVRSRHVPRGEDLELVDWGHNGRAMHLLLDHPVPEAK